EVTASRVHRGDAEDITNGAVRGAAPALAQDLAIARHLDDLMRAQKIIGLVQSIDKIELFFELLADEPGSPPLAVATRAPLLHEAAQCLHGRLSGAAELVAREAVRQAAEAERALLCDLDRALHPRELIAEDGGHLGGRAEHGLGVGEQARAGL